MEKVYGIYINNSTADGDYSHMINTVFTSLDKAESYLAKEYGLYKDEDCMLSMTTVIYSPLDDYKGIDAEIIEMKVV